jgi:hypothetical protein
MELKNRWSKFGGYVMPKNIGLKLFTVIVLLGGATIPVLGQKGKSQPTKKVTLHEQAKKAGGKFVMRYRPNRGTIYPNIEELAKRTDLIVVGRTLSHKASLTPDERFITQDFLVKVQEVIKGDLPRGRSVLVSMPGGTHRFADGVYAAMMPVGHKQPEDSGIYVFFLKAKKKGSPLKGYRLISESQGLFKLTPNGTVEPADLVREDPVSVRYREMNAARFLQELHKAVPRKGNKQR